MSQRPNLIGVCGGSASGKSFLVSQLSSHFGPGRMTVVSQDNYYFPLEQQPRDAEGLVNFDHPEAVDLHSLLEDIRLLMAGERLLRTQYGFNNPEHLPSQIALEPAPLILVEGLFVFHLPEMAQAFDLKIFVEAEEHVKLARRLRRDHAERGYSIEEILRDYERFVAPMYYRYVEPARHQSDLIIPNNRHMYRALQVLLNHLRLMVQEG
jgi:uridine kinase